MKAVAGWLATLAVFAGVVGGGVYAWPMLTGEDTSDDDQVAVLDKAGRGPLRIVVTEDGNVESANNINVKCQVSGGSTILWIVEDGKEVKEGEDIVKLDPSTIQEQLDAQEIVCAKAKAAKLQADEAFAAADLAVEEYLQGTFVQLQQEAQATITIAEENLRSAKNVVEHTQRMLRKGFVTPLQLEADKFAVQRADLELKSATTAKWVLEEFTKRKTRRELEAVRDAAAAQRDAEAAALRLEESRRDKLTEQVGYCTLTAPQAGMVVYANSNSRRRSSSEPQIEEGAMVREQQDIVRIPDLANMQVKVTVHETKVEQIAPGRKAKIEIQGRQLTGEVVSVANQPEQGGWFSANVKNYATIVKILDATDGLKPGMTAQVDIVVDELEDVLTVPVSAVVEQTGKFYAWVEGNAGPERRPLLLGKTDDRVIEIRDGIKTGDLVYRNPRAHIPEARDEVFNPGQEGGPGGGRPGAGRRPSAGAGGRPGAGAGQRSGGGSGAGRGQQRPAGGKPSGAQPAA